MKRLLALGLFLLAGMVGWLVWNRQLDDNLVTSPLIVPTGSSKLRPQVPSNLTKRTAAELTQQQSSNAPMAIASSLRSNTPSTGILATNHSAQASAQSSNAPVQDPFARFALMFVGVDPDAEMYWLLAINDLNLPPNERQDLIEDLNEDGFADPKHPTPDDLPLIFNRLAIIEELADGAMDQVNADALQEAYKDLLNLAALAMGNGQPVR